MSKLSLNCCDFIFSHLVGFSVVYREFGFSHFWSAMGMLFHLASLQYNACVSYATETFSLLEMLVFQLNKEV